MPLREVPNCVGVAVLVGSMVLSRLLNTNCLILVSAISLPVLGCVYYLVQ